MPLAWLAPGVPFWQLKRWAIVERPSGASRGRAPFDFAQGQVRVTRIKINIKGVGQGCPTHMGSEDNDGE
jgi:hypothetical protein